MSRWVRRASPYFTRVLTSPKTREFRRHRAERRRRRKGEPHRVLYFHQVDDPYSALVVQVLSEFLERYDVVLEPHLVGPPPEEAAPERERLEVFARKDAADVAPAYGLSFPRREVPPPTEAVELAARMLVSAIGGETFAQVAARITRALWDSGESVAELAAELPIEAATAARDAAVAGDLLRAKLGHYLGGMLYYAGEWYWGVDRLHHLERRLQSVGALRAGMRADAIAPRPDFRDAKPIESDQRLHLEYYPSLRSPYTAIAMERVFALAQRLPVELHIRPVLPMVMRGLPVPRAKRMYIVLDTKREAEDAEVAFGNLCDPVGRPVERAFSLYPWACEQGRDAAFLESFTRAAFSEGIDTGEDAGLKHVVERSGLSWDQARKHVDQEGWRDTLEENRRCMFELGLWGVPSFRLLSSDGEPDFSTWGQDRIWLVEQAIRRRLGARNDPGRTE